MQILINCYVRILTDLPLADPEDEMLPELCKEEDATLKWIFSMIVCFQVGRYVCWNKSTTMFVVQIQNEAG